MRLWISKWILGPQIYRIHNVQYPRVEARNYQPNSYEQKAQTILSLLSTSKFILVYTSPIWISMLYRRDYFTQEYLNFLLKISGWGALFLVGVYLMRAFGRSQNQDYLNLMEILDDLRVDSSDLEYRKRLRDYDFEMTHWPADYTYQERSGGDDDDKKTAAVTKSRISNWQRISSQHGNSTFQTLLFGLPKEILSYLISHSFGISVAYPGSMSMLKAAYGNILLESRGKMIEEKGGLRSKIITEDGNAIDTMFVDRRHEDDSYQKRKLPSVTSSNGGNARTLVICCEGNAGFYEVGCMVTPLAAGYSVLGWNHPGFAESTGTPFPEAEVHAIDAVMQYAINELKFQPENIMMMAWSIGGFTAINAAGLYPDINGVVLDATFYDIMPFATRMFPTFAEPLTRYAVRNYLNLHNSENLKKYHGPVKLVRRTQDEVMNIAGPTALKSNLGNKLLEELLRHRYPHMFDDVTGYQSKALWEWMSTSSPNVKDALLTSYGVEDTTCRHFIRQYLMKNPFSKFPLGVGKDLSESEKAQLVLFLAKEHMVDYSSTHCTPLPHYYFTQPLTLSSIVMSSSLDNDSSSGSDFEVVL